MSLQSLQPDGKILVGFFTSIGGQARNSVARLDPTGAADSFDPSANASVFTLAVQSDGKVVVGGPFTSVGGQPRNHIARVDATGPVDVFNPDANNFVQSVSLQADGKVLVGGTCTTIGGQARNLCARLTNDTGALSTLTVAKTAVTLTRDGSAPQLTRVTFEQSVDNVVTYTALGNGTPQGSSYTVSGLNLPSGQNVLVRARGFYRMA